MKKNKFVRGLSLIIFGAICGWGVAYAKNTSTHQPATNADQIQSQNTRHKMPHSQRKEAAARLKVAYVQDRENRLLTIAHAHRGYTGQGKEGGQNEHKPN